MFFTQGSCCDVWMCDVNERRQEDCFTCAQVCKTAMPCLNGSLISLASLEFSVGLLPEQLVSVEGLSGWGWGQWGWGRGWGQWRSLRSSQSITPLKLPKPDGGGGTSIEPSPISGQCKVTTTWIHRNSNIDSPEVSCLRPACSHGPLAAACNMRLWDFGFESTKNQMSCLHCYSISAQNASNIFKKKTEMYSQYW